MPLPKVQCRIELHVHLDGAVRAETVHDLFVRKHFPLPGDGSVEAMRQALVVTDPDDLAAFLKPLHEYIQKAVQDDAEAIERIAYEFCEDKSKEHVLYVEVRYSPHLLSGPKNTPHDVVVAVNKGLNRGQLDFGIKVRSILCCIRGFPDWDVEVLRLCEEFKNDGVVGIDIAGGGANGDEALDEEDIKTFQNAASKGIHRTVHAGEASGPERVQEAIESMKAERIGHGYRVLQDPTVYQRVKDLRIHLETCPNSSILTGSVPKDCEKHPIVRFAEDKANFSINTDDPSITGTTLNDEYAFLFERDLTEVHFFTANLNACRASFLPELEKHELEQKLLEIYGVSNRTFSDTPQRQKHIMSPKPSVTQSNLPIYMKSLSVEPNIEIVPRQTADRSTVAGRPKSENFVSAMASSPPQAQKSEGEGTSNKTFRLFGEPVTIDRTKRPTEDVKPPAYRESLRQNVEIMSWNNRRDDE